MPQRPSPKHAIRTTLMLVLPAALLVLGLVRLFSLRFSSGEIYPVYSTLRADPLGAKLFYQSLEHSGILTSVDRHFTKLDELDYPPDTTFVILAAQERFDFTHDRIERGMAASFFSLMHGGGRVALSYSPYFHYDAPTRDDEEENEEDDEVEVMLAEAGTTNVVMLGTNVVTLGTNLCCEASEATNTVASAFLSNTLHTAAWLGFETGYVRRPDPKTATATRLVELTELPATLHCGTDLCFTNLSTAWTTLYAREGHPVVIERRVGEGSLALSTLSYPVSNEALRDDRSSAFLLWFIGNTSHHVRFSERHLGLMHDPNTASLIRKHHLHWPLLGLLATALLLVWQQASSLLPRHDDDASVRASSGSGDSTQAMTNLLRRSIPGNRIAACCQEQWEESLPPMTRQRDALVEAVRLAQQPKSEGRQGDRHLVERYNETVTVIRAAKHTGATTTAQLNRQKGATT